MTTKAKTTKTMSADTAAKAYEEAISSGKDQVESVVKATTDAAVKGYEQALAAGQRNMDAAVKRYDDFTAFGREAVEAWIAAGNAATKGIEALNAEMMAFGKSQFDDGVAASKGVMSARTLKEAFEMQSEFAKTSFDAMMSESTKIGQMVAKTSQDAAAPINATYQTAFDRFVKPFATR